MCGLGPWELMIVFAIVVLLFGATRLPQLGKALGETVRNFKKGQNGPQKVQEPKPKEPMAPAHEVAQLVDENGDKDAAADGDKDKDKSDAS